MGFLHPDRADIAISYRHADDQFNLGWVGDFREKFESTLKGALQRKGIGSSEAGFVHVALDQFDLAQSGNVNQRLVELIGQATVLIVIAGAAYQYSEYCARELEIFRSKHGDDFDHAVNHTYVLIIDREFFEGLRRNEHPSASLGKAEQEAANRIRNLTDDNLFINYFSQTTGYALDQETGAFKDRLQRLARAIADQLIAARSGAGFQPAPVQVQGLALKPAPVLKAELHEADADFVANGRPLWLLAPVVTRLRPDRDALAHELEALDLAVTALEFDDLVERGQWDKDTLADRLKGAQGIIQLFDAGEPEYRRRDPVEGHLSLCDGLESPHAAIRRLWWQPRKDDLQEPLDDPEFTAFLARIESQFGPTHLELEDFLATHLVPRDDKPEGEKAIAIGVLVDSVSADVAPATERVEAAWRARVQARAQGEVLPMLEFWKEPWAEFSTGEAERGGFPVLDHAGYILLDQKQDDLAYEAKVGLLRKLAFRSAPPRAAGVFVLPPQERGRRVPAAWPVLRFSEVDHDWAVDEAELERFMEGLERSFRRQGAF